MTTTTATVVQEAVELRAIPQLEAQPTPRLLEEPEPDTSLDETTILKLISAGLSFYVAGVNDGSLGALMPYLLRSYQISTAIISVV